MLPVQSHLFKYIPILAGMCLLLGFQGFARAADKQSDTAAPFAVAKIHFERNATDGDVEAVFEVKGGQEGLSRLTVISPDGRTVIDFTAPDPSTMGIRQFCFESPEPDDIESLKSAYPGGVYTFTGTTSAGIKLYSQSGLSHKLPATSSLLRPRNRKWELNVKNAKITWTPDKNVAGYIIEIKQDELDVELTAKLPGSATEFAVPAGFLIPGVEYELSIGTLSEGGNISFAETTFTTTGK